jgi:hypothetical protein
MIIAYLFRCIELCVFGIYVRISDMLMFRPLRIFLTVVGLQNLPLKKRVTVEGESLVYFAKSERFKKLSFIIKCTLSMNCFIIVPSALEALKMRLRCLNRYRVIYFAAIDSKKDCQQAGNAKL